MNFYSLSKKIFVSLSQKQKIDRRNRNRIPSNATTLLTIPQDIIQTHILSRLDAISLASLAATSSELHTLCSHEPLWSNLCHSTWPSTNDPRVRSFISTPNVSYRSFFSHCFIPFPLRLIHINHCTLKQLIIAVDLFHGEELIYSDVVEVDKIIGDGSLKGYGRVKLPEMPCNCEEELRLSLIVINPLERWAVNYLPHGRVLSYIMHRITCREENEGFYIEEFEEGIRKLQRLSIIP